MTAALQVLSVLPDQFNVNGDAENATVLAARSRWGGHTAEVQVLAPGDPTPALSPQVIVIGSGTDALLPRLRDELLRHREALAGWIAAGVPLLAVGTGWELLGESIELPSGILAGLGILPGRAVAAGVRVSDDLVVSTRFGRLVGYENHARDYLLPPEGEALGEIVYGRGNGAGASSEGLIFGNVLATHLHGPILAKNPAVADHLLTLALGEEYDPRTPQSERVDEIARAARNRIATRLELRED